MIKAFNSYANYYAYKLLYSLFKENVISSGKCRISVGVNISMMNECYEQLMNEYQDEIIEQTDTIDIIIMKKEHNEFNTIVREGLINARSCYVANIATLHRPSERQVFILLDKVIAGMESEICDVITEHRRR